MWRSKIKITKPCCVLFEILLLCKMGKNFNWTRWICCFTSYNFTTVYKFTISMFPLFLLFLGKLFDKSKWYITPSCIKLLILMKTIYLKSQPSINLSHRSFTASCLFITGYGSLVFMLTSSTMCYAVNGAACIYLIDASFFLMTWSEPFILILILNTLFC